MICSILWEVIFVIFKDWFSGWESLGSHIQLELFNIMQWKYKLKNMQSK